MNKPYWRKEAIECSVEELHKKKKIVKLLKWMFIVEAIVLLTIVIYTLYMGGLYIIASAAGILFLNFQILYIFDVSNDSNRLNIWIFLKTKLGDIDEKILCEKNKKKT